MIDNVKTGIFCPICKTEYEISINVNEHPNSMYSIRSCVHINISRCLNEEIALDELKGERIMGIDYNGVGGIGIEVTDVMIETFIKNNVFTEEEWEEDRHSCMEDLDIDYAEAGNTYADTGHFYLFVDGNTLVGINENVDIFIDRLKVVGVNIMKEDLKVISDYIVW